MTSKRDAYRGIVAAVDRMVNRGDEADAVLRAVVELLQARLGNVSWAAISLVEAGKLVLGPSRGSHANGAALAVPIEYRGRPVGELVVEANEADAFDGEDRVSLERIAVLISQHALVGWDTGGETWSP